MFVAFSRPCFHRGCESSFEPVETEIRMSVMVVKAPMKNPNKIRANDLPLIEFLGAGALSELRCLKSTLFG